MREAPIYNLLHLVMFKLVAAIPYLNIKEIIFLNCIFGPFYYAQNVILEIFYL